MHTLRSRWLGRVSYHEATSLQLALHGNTADDYLLLLEHPHTFTIGRRAKNNGILANAEILKSIGAEVFETNPE